MIMTNEPVTVTQRFATNKADLYRAWTEESALKEWWKPAGQTLSSVQNDITEGGKVSYSFEADNESEGKLTIDGEYKVAEPEEKLVYTWNWSVDDAALENGNYTLTVEFAENDGEAQLAITQESVTENEGIHPHKDGWQQALQSLAEYLESSKQ